MDFVVNVAAAGAPTAFLTILGMGIVWFFKRLKCTLDLGVVVVDASDGSGTTGGGDGDTDSVVLLLVVVVAAATGASKGLEGGITTSKTFVVFCSS